MNDITIIQLSTQDLKKLIREAIREENNKGEDQKGTKEKEPFLSVKEAAKLLEVAPQTIHVWKKNKKLPFHRFGGSPKFLESELRAWAKVKRA